MPTSTLLGWTIPSDTSDPWFTTMVALINQIDAAVAGQKASMQFWNTSAPTPGATTFLGRGNGAQALVRFPSPVTGVITRIVTLADTTPGAGQSWTYTVNIDTVDSVLSLVVGAGQFTGTLTGAVAVTQGAQLAIKLALSGTAAPGNHAVTIAIQVTG